MKKIKLFVFAASIMSATLLTSCFDIKKDSFIVVGLQQGSLTAGEEGEVTFPVIVNNIEESAAGTVLWYSDITATVPADKLGFVSATLPSGGEKRTLTMKVRSNSVAGTYWFRAVINGIESQGTNKLIIMESDVKKTVSVGAQDGKLIAGTAGKVTYPVTTNNIADGDFEVTVANLPKGVSVSGKVSIYKNVGTLTLEGNASTEAGVTSTLTMKIDNVTSVAFTITIEKEDEKVEKTVSVGTQDGILIAGTAGKVNFPITTANFDDGEYEVTIANLPKEVSISGKVNIYKNAGTLTLEGNTSTEAGVISTLTLTISGITSPTFTLTIVTPAAKAVSVGAQSGILTAGTAGTVTFPVTTTNIADGAYNVTVANLPTGVSVSGQVTIYKNAGTLTLAGNTSTVAGTTRTPALTIDGATSPAFSLTISTAAEKAVSVGEQVGILTAGTAGTITFPVTTANIADGAYSVTVANLPTGVSVSGQVSIYKNAGTLTLDGNTSTVADVINILKLNIDGITSPSFSLTISAAAEKTVSVGAQNGILIAGTAGSISFPVTTSNITDGTYNVTVTNLPTGVSASGQVRINNNSGTLNLNGNTSTVAGVTSTLTLTIDGATSAAFTLTIVDPAAKTVSVGEQTGTMTAGEITRATYTVTTANIADGVYTVTVANLPAGVSVAGQVTINNNSGSLMLAGNTSTVAGITSTLTLTLNGATSAAFTLTIEVAAVVKTVSVNSMIESYLNAGIAGTISFPVTTTNIANGSYTATVVNLPTGVSVSGQVTINNNSGMLTLAGNTSTVAGNTSNLILIIDGTSSAAFSLIIKEVQKTVLVGEQVGSLTAGTAGTVTFPVTTANIINGTYSVTVANRPTGVSVSGQVTINNNSGTLTLAGNTSTEAGSTSTLTMTIDGATSSAFTLTIEEPSGEKSVSVGAQSGTLTAGTAGMATFSINTSYIADYQTGIIQWFIDSLGMYPINPSDNGLILTSTTVSTGSASRTMTVNIAANSRADKYWFRVTIDGVVSNVGTLIVNPAPVKTVSVGAQVGTLTAGTEGTVTFPVSTANIANGSYTVTVANLPMGVGVSGQVTINNNFGTLTLTTSLTAGTTAGVTPTLTLTIDGATSEAFTLTISAAPVVKTVTVEAQVGTLVEGTNSAITFPVNTTGITDGTSGTVVFTNSSGTPSMFFPAGFTLSVSNVSGNTATVSISASTVAQAGTFYFTVTIDGVTSAVITFTVEAKTISIGAQVGTLKPGIGASSATFSVTTKHILTTSPGTIQWYSDAAGTVSASAPSGISAPSLSIGSENRTLSIAAVPISTRPAGTYWFRVTIDGVSSDVGTLVIGN